MVALREPALGPTFGIKGGATGGYAQALPMEDINLHFNGTTANNALSAFIDNHLHRQMKGIDQRRIEWKRVRYE